jgi:hypothetical protein
MKIVIDGENIHPASMDAAELGKFLISYSSAVKEIKSESNSFIAIEGIEDNCIAIKFKANRSAAVAHLTLIAFLSGEAVSISETCQKHVKEMISFSRVHSATILLPGSRRHKSFTINKDTRLPHRQAMKHRYQTRIYGELVEVGGVTPNIHLVYRGKKITCRIPTKEMAVELGRRLYDFIGLEGTATVEGGSWEIQEFSVSGILPYSHKPGKDPFSKLRELAAPYFNGVDADQYAKELREG